MAHHAGSNVSLEPTAGCVIDAAGAVVGMRRVPAVRGSEA
jgi:hypothetical protein